MTNPSNQLIKEIEEFISVRRPPVRLALLAESSFEVSVQCLSTSQNSRRQGYASEIMNELIEIADRLEVELFLEALPEELDDSEDNISLNSLVEFYGRFGFVRRRVAGAESVWMNRYPIIKKNSATPRYHRTHPKLQLNPGYRRPRRPTMATIVDYDDTAKSRITCKFSSHRVGCGAIIEYTKNDVKQYTGTDIGGGPDGREWIACPGCGQDITLRSW